MMTTVTKHLGKIEHRFVADDQWRIDGQAATDFLHDCATQNEPVSILGTAISYVHLLDFLDAERVELRLPAGSAAMETGGYKGRSREVAKRSCTGRSLPGLVSSRSGSFANMACAN